MEDSVRSAGAQWAKPFSKVPPVACLISVIRHWTAFAGSFLHIASARHIMVNFLLAAVFSDEVHDAVVNLSFEPHRLSAFTEVFQGDLAEMLGNELVGFAPDNLRDAAPV